MEKNNMRDLFYEQKLTYNIAHELTVDTLANLHKSHGQLIAERNCRKEIERLEKERQQIQQEKVVVEEICAEDIWKDLEEEDDPDEYVEEDNWRDEPYEILKEKMLEERYAEADR